MNLYDALVRPAGQLTHEVPKFSLTAAEVILLRSIHGDDGVVQLRRSKSQGSIHDVTERERLKAVYGEKAFARVFGSTFGSQLPQEVPPDWMAGAVPAAEPDLPPETVAAPERPVLSRKPAESAAAR